jgi:hypothetical protein
MPLAVAAFAVLPVLAKEQGVIDPGKSPGVFPRLRHAVISTLTALRGEDGHRVFSLPALIAPSAGTMNAVHAWCPGRYNGKDALQISNCTLLGYVGGNMVLELLPSGPHFLLCRTHLNNWHGTPSSGSNP